MAVSANRLELLQIADAVAREKSIPREVVLQSMEDALQKAARSRYGQETEVRCRTPVLPNLKGHYGQQNPQNPRGGGAQILSPLPDLHAEYVRAQGDPDNGQGRCHQIHAVICENGKLWPQREDRDHTAPLAGDP